ncbi:MAG: NAD(P)-dependent oxidoreductase [Bacteroidota bacterium]|nr:NAD(P)-dependent oxidoreductase [Bacteroidota bacterium]
MNIIIIDRVHEYLAKSLTKAGFNVSDKQNIEPKNILAILKNYEGIIIRSKIKLTEEILSDLPNLKFIARVGAGMESIDEKAAEKLNIKLLNAPEGNRDSVGEHALGMILSLFNKICTANIQVKSGIWQREPNRGIELMGKTVGIIGYGNMGGAFAKRLSGFGANVIAYDKYKTNFSDEYCQEVDLQTIFNETDVLSLHVPLTKETFYLFDNSFINNFKKAFYLINTARGKIVKTTDLVENIKSKKILGSALDVLEYEKVSFEKLSLNNNKEINYLINAENVIMSPHIAGLTHDSNFKLAEVTAQKIINLFS